MNILIEHIDHYAHTPSMQKDARLLGEIARDAWKHQLFVELNYRENGNLIKCEGFIDKIEHEKKLVKFFFIDGDVEYIRINRIIDIKRL